MFLLLKGMFRGQDGTQGSVVGVMLLMKAQEVQILELTLRVCGGIVPSISVSVVLRTTLS